MAYTRLARLPETAWARHLDNIRRERGWSVVQLFEDVRDDLHLGPKSRSAFHSRLHGFQPRDDDEAAILIARYGEPGPDLTPEPEPEPAPDFAAVLLKFSGELEAMREEREALRRERDALRVDRELLEALRLTVDRLVAEGHPGLGSGGSAARPVPPAAAE